MEQQAEDLQLLLKVLEIYDQKQIANFLNELGQDNWTRETVNRWLKGKSQPKLSHAEFEHLKSLLPLTIMSDSKS
jgi:DNA (cytosine-5)-methyltransferase 1